MLFRTLDFSAFSPVAGATCAMIAWGLAVAGHPSRWTALGIVVSAVYSTAISIVIYRRPSVFAGPFSLVTSLVWLTLVSTSFIEVSEGVSASLAEVVARRTLAWLWLVLPAVAATGNRRTRPHEEGAVAVRLFVCACAGTIAVAVGLPHDSSPTPSPLWYSERAMSAILIALPWALNYFLSRESEV